MTIPCPFPRLRFTVYDFETLSSDESLGEAVISFRKYKEILLQKISKLFFPVWRILKKLRTEGKFEMPQRKIKLHHPNFPDDDRVKLI